MQKKLGLSLIVLALCAGFGFAFDLNGFEVNIDLDVNVFELRKEEKSDVELRRGAGNFKPLTIAGPFGGYNLNGDTNLYLTYTGKYFGGTFGLCVEDDFMVKVPTLKAWVKPFGDWFKATIGKDIGFNYVDNLDADPGMRIYYGATQSAWADTKDPDDITQDEGVLLEGFLKPVTIAMAGRYYNPSVFPIAINSNVPDRTKDEWKYVDQTKFSYGARVGSEIGSFGKVNASYIIEYSNWASSNQQDYYGVDLNNEVVPKRADAEVMDHLFGIYASLVPLKNFGVSIGYNGIITKYLDEFYAGTGWQTTTQPLVYKQAINLNLRYSGVPKWTFRTDNNISFWTDKNYLIFAIAETDMGIVPETQGKNYSDVNHLLIWNGLGVKYQITDALRAELYVRNLYRKDTAKEGFQFTRDKIAGELKGIWAPSPILELYVGLTLENETTTISKDVNQRNTSSSMGFISGVAEETVDSVFTFKVPMGITIKMR